MLETSHPPLRLYMAYGMIFPDTPLERVFQAPGREMWIAYHLAAPERANAAPTYELHSVDAGGDVPVVFTLQSAKTKRAVTKRPLPRWARYAAGALVMLDLPGMEACGIHGVIGGDEPHGPRYDFAISMLFAALLYDLAGTTVSLARLIEIADRVNRDYVEGA